MKVHDCVLSITWIRVTFTYGSLLFLQVLEEAETSLETAQEKCKEILNVLEERN